MNYFIFDIAFVIGLILLLADSSNLLVLLLIKVVGFTLMVSSAYTRAKIKRKGRKAFFIVQFTKNRKRNNDSKQMYAFVRYVRYRTKYRGNLSFLYSSCILLQKTT